MKIINVKRGQIQSIEKRKHQYIIGSKDSVKKIKIQPVSSLGEKKKKDTAHKKIRDYRKEEIIRF